MLLHYIFLLILLVHTPIYSVIVIAEKLTKNNYNQYIYYDVHPWQTLPEEEKQLDAIVTLLENRENTSEKPIDIIIEQPLSIVKLLNKSPRITGSLKKRIKKKKLTKTTIVPAEIRCASLGAMFLLQEKINPQTIFPYLEFKNKYATYLVKDITFNDLIKELYFHKKRLESFLKFISQEKTLLSNQVKLLDKYFINFKDTLNKYNTPMDKPILDYAKYLKNNYNEKGRINLYIKISDLFAHLFDLHLFKLMYSRLRDNQDAMLISGYMHSQKVKQMLNQLDLFSDSNNWCNII